MSANIKTFTNFNRMDQDKYGRKIPVYRQVKIYLTKEETVRAKELKENLKLNVS